VRLFVPSGRISHENLVTGFPYDLTTGGILFTLTAINTGVFVSVPEPIFFQSMTLATVALPKSPLADRSTLCYVTMTKHDRMPLLVGQEI
jgi:hypothetical protein